MVEEIENKITERLQNYDVTAYNEPNEPNGEVFDDGFTHITRKGVRYAIWTDYEGSSWAKMKALNKKWARIVDKIIEEEGL